MDLCATAITLFQTTSPRLARFHGVDAGSLVKRFACFSLFSQASEISRVKANRSSRRRGMLGGANRNNGLKKMRNAHGHIFMTNHLQFSPRLVCAEVTLVSRRLIRDTFVWLTPRGAIPHLPNLKSSVRSDALHAHTSFGHRLDIGDPPKDNREKRTCGARTLTQRSKSNLNKPRHLEPL